VQGRAALAGWTRVRGRLQYAGDRHLTYQPAMPHCAFCELPPDRPILATAHAVAIRDAFPVSEGHTLIIPRRHITSFFDATAEERADMMRLLELARESLEQEFRPAGYNIGINDGPAAGQTVLHMHIHLIPRYSGDRLDPRGGIRWVLPDKADYWSKD